MQALEYTENGWRFPIEESMERRAVKHDYYAPSIYMVTLTTMGREPLFGTLIADEDNPRITWTEVGKMVAEEIDKIPVYTPAVRILQKVIMPDHVHLLLQVTECLPRHFSLVIRGFKQGCTKRYRKIVACASPFKGSSPWSSQRMRPIDGSLHALFQEGVSALPLCR